MALKDKSVTITCASEDYKDVITASSGTLADIQNFMNATKGNSNFVAIGGTVYKVEDTVNFFEGLAPKEDLKYKKLKLTTDSHDTITIIGYFPSSAEELDKISTKLKTLTLKGNKKIIKVALSTGDLELA